MGDHSKKHKAPQAEEPVALVAISRCYSCYLHGIWDHKFLQNGRDVLRARELGHRQAQWRAGRENCCSQISSANLLTTQPPRVQSTSVPSPSLATLQPFGRTASLHPTGIHSAGGATVCLPPACAWGVALKMQVQQETRK